MGTHKKRLFQAVFMGLQVLYTLFFPSSVLTLEGKVQGFLRFHRKILALEQRKTVLKALACKDNCVVQYTLFTDHAVSAHDRIDDGLILFFNEK